LTSNSGPELHQTTYDRMATQIGIIHVGYGAFHRAHQAVYFDDYMDATGDLNWGIAAVNLRASERTEFTMAARAPSGYLLKTTSPSGERRFRLVRSHREFADWSADAMNAQALFARPCVHAVTITVTESGYYLNDDHALNINDPIIAAEIEGKAKQSVYAFLTAALDQRVAASGQPLSILCCDNIRGNGEMLKRNFRSYLESVGRLDLRDWVDIHARFPNSMVDRITPRATAVLEREVAGLFPDMASSAIHAEAFSQWALDDDFAGAFPDLSKVGVDVVRDVTPYEEAKIRILNGGHIGLAYLGALAGHQTFDAAMRDERLRGHFEGWEKNEVLPGLDIDLPFDKEAYLDEIRARFGNVAISDSLERICMDGYSKMPIYIRPTLEACLNQGIIPRHGFDCVASWYVYARRFAAGTMPVVYHEPYWTVLKPFLVEGQETAFASLEQLWGDLPKKHDAFVNSITSAIRKIDEAWPA